MPGNNKVSIKRHILDPRFLLDSSQVDKTVFLAYVCFIPLFIYAGTIAYGLWSQFIQPTHNLLNPNAAALLLCIALAHFFTLVFVVRKGNTIRQSANKADNLWYLVSFTWAISMLSITFLAGTYYADGILMLLMGFNISLPLQRYRALMIAFVTTVGGFIGFTVLDLSGTLQAGLLFQDHNDATWAPWLYARIAVGLYTFASAFFACQTIASWKRREGEYRHLSKTDGLTLLSNRSHFLQHSAMAFSQAGRRTDALACILMDLDYFKQINDNYGHHAGDQVLVAVAKILKQNARDYDEVSRIGGEEFAILMPATTSNVAAQIATRIREKLESSEINVDGTNLKVTASFGVACYPDENVGCVEDLLKKADIALYSAKRDGRNRVVVSGKQNSDFIKSA